MSSGRHRRRMNWEGVVLNQRLAAIAHGYTVPYTGMVEQELGHIHTYLRNRVDLALSRARVLEGIDRWEDDGGALYGGAGAE